MTGLRQHVQPGTVWASCTGLLWEIIGVTSGGTARLYRLGELPGTAGGWKPLTRTTEELVARWSYVPDVRGRHTYARASLLAAEGL